jgi:hypothetical protein
LDAWGNNGVPFTNGDGIVFIDEVLSSENTQQYPREFSINRIFPNPFNPVTKISFDIPFGLNEKTSIQIFDLTGRWIETLIHKKLESGSYQINWQPAQVPSGLYFLEMRSGSKRAIQKITLLK